MRKEKAKINCRRNSDAIQSKSKLNVIEEEDIDKDIARENINESDKRKNVRIFVLFLLMNVFLNYDTGVIPGALIHMSEDLHFDKEQMAYLGSLVYLGL